MSKYRVVDCHGFAGAFSVAAVQSGFELVGKLEGPGGFGTPLMEANRAFLGDAWEAQEGEAHTWEHVGGRVDLQVGTPPCTAFSGMSVGSKDRGMSGSINKCMWDFVEYAAKVRPAIVMMESVSQAYTRGRPLMRRLAARLNELTGLAYQTTHVLQNNLSTGGCTNRRRYFLVLSQVPFGVEVPVLQQLPTIEDAIGDLCGLKIRWDEQPVKHSPSWWAKRLRREDGLVDGHYTDDTPFARAMRTVTRDDGGVEWAPGEDVNATLRAYYRKHGRLPEEWHDRPYHGKRGDEAGRFTTQEAALVGQNFNTGGFARARRWRWNRPGFVITGAGFYSTWHPEGRYYTHREIARVMGFPDAYVVGEARTERALCAYWGKGTSVAPAKFVTDWAHRSLDGNPGTVVGELLDEGDRLIDVSNIWRPVARAQFGTTQFGGKSDIRREARVIAEAAAAAVAA